MAGEHAGRSIIEMLWEQADIMYAKLMDGQHWPLDSAPWREKNAQAVADYWELRGKLGGLTFSLSVMLDSYAEDRAEAMNKIKAMLRKRWEDAEAEEDDEEDE